MSRQSWFNALCYEAGLWAVSKRPSLAFQPWFKLLMANCRPDWTEWKTKVTLKAVDKQAKVLVEQWEKDEREQKAAMLAIKAQELFPQSTVVPVPDAPVPSVMIITEAPASASDEVKALGGELRITYRLD